MRRRTFQAVTVAGCTFLATVMPVGFVQLLDGHAVSSAEETLQDYASRTVSHVDQKIDEGVLVVTDLYAAGATRCDAGAQAAMRRAIYETYLLREVAVVDQANAVLCGDSIIDTNRWTLSRHTAVDVAIDVSVALAYGTYERSLAIRFRPTEGPAIITHFAPRSLALDILPDRWRRDGQVALAMVDGTAFEQIPRIVEASAGTSGGDGEGEWIDVSTSSERYPVQVDMRVSKAVVMESYAELQHYAYAVMSVFVLIVFGLALALVRRRPSAADDIAYGLRRGEFIPYYQPVIDLSSGRLEGAEVLVRRRRRDGTIEVPAAFIAQAESDGQIIPITRSLMRQVISDLGPAYRRRHDMSVAFNLCAKHFQDDRIISDVEEAFGNSAIQFDQLVFEVTERYPLADMTTAKLLMSRLQALGARIALDDAGTGHSGLAALHRLGIDIVKVDKLFIDPIEADTTSAPIVDSLVELSHSLKMSVIAEGVETLDQVNYLRSKGVQQAQGYLFAPPLPASSFLRLVEAMSPLGDAATDVSAAA